MAPPAERRSPPVGTENVVGRSTSTRKTRRQSTHLTTVTASCGTKSENPTPVSSCETKASTRPTQLGQNTCEDPAALASTVPINRVTLRHNGSCKPVALERQHDPIVRGFCRE
ncbi:MAG: hypothetical protein RL345_2108 [Chloroflexota bacterium]